MGQLNLKDAEVLRLQGMIRNLSQRESAAGVKELAESRLQVERQNAEITKLQAMVQSLMQRDGDIARLQDLVQNLGDQLRDRDRKDEETSKFRKDEEEAALQSAEAGDVFRKKSPGSPDRLPIRGLGLSTNHAVTVNATCPPQQKEYTATATLTIPSVAFKEKTGTKQQLSAPSGDAEAAACDMKASTDRVMELSRLLQGQTAELLSFSETLRPAQMTELSPRTTSQSPSRSPRTREGFPEEGFFQFQAEALRSERDAAIVNANQLRKELAFLTSENSRLTHELQLERSTNQEADVRYRILFREKQELSNRVQSLYRNMESLVAETTHLNAR